MPVDRIQEAIREVFDLRPAAIIRDLDLLRPIYAQTAAYGHFGRELAGLHLGAHRPRRGPALGAAADRLRPHAPRRSGCRGPSGTVTGDGRASPSVPVMG